MGLVTCGKKVRGVHDQGVVLRQSKPGEPYYWLDSKVIRQAVILREEARNRFLLYYDALGPEATSITLRLAESDDFIPGNKLGPAQVPAVFEYPSADYRQFSNYLECGSPWFIEEDGTFYMFNTSDTGPKGNFAPMPYYATLSFGPSLAGPWQKETLLPGRGKHIAIPVRPGTYYSDTACAGSVMENPAWQGPEDRENRRYMMFFSAASCHGKPGDYRSLGRGVGIARSDCLTAADDYDKLEGNFWEPDPAPIIPLEDDVENATLFHDADRGIWYLFVNHIDSSNTYTDAIWVYWSEDPNRWDPNNKAEVLSSESCSWTHGAIGMPSVLRVGDRLAMFYDGSVNGDTTHFNRNIALAYIDLPLEAE